MKNKICLASLPILATVPVPVQVGAVKNYTLTASAEKKEERIIVSGKTNLPDGCVLGVFIERPYWRKGLLVPLDPHEAERNLIERPIYWRKEDDTTYTGHMAFGEATVEKGSYEVSLTPDDVGWYDNAIMLIE
ncbi:MAG: hypothetical protein PHY36_02670, partial [Methanocellales archaeon]|nr:hypothetical protein [Methanocellales archaeon]